MAPKKTKIVCTLGPASKTPEVLRQMIDAGLDVARLNFSHGSFDDHRAHYQRVRDTAAAARKEVAILQDLQGPKIRVGKLQGGRMELAAGAEVAIRPGEDQPAADIIPTTYAELPGDVEEGDSILMDDGLLRLRVKGVSGDDVRCEVLVGGILKDRKGINLPGVKVSAPALTDKDLADLAFGTELGVDFVSLSFVRRPEDVEQAKAELRKYGRNTPVIAKIEKPEAVENLDAILDVTDGIMVARGDLGVEMGPEKVPLIQKRAIEAANARGKLVITATQMLESMVTSAFPTRAEASDVANAVLDQSDAVMLSGETAAGAHPALVVQTMVRIIQEVEGSERYRRLAEPLAPEEMTDTNNAIAHAAAAAAASLDEIRAIICLTSDGATPRLLSDYRPEVPVYALSHDAGVCRQLAAFWGVTPLHFPKHDDFEETVTRVDALLVERGLVAAGERVVITTVVPPNSTSPTDTLTIRRVGDRRPA